MKGWRRDKEGRIYFKINVAEEEKIATFASRSGRRGKLVNTGILKSRQGKKRRQKNKIYFIWKFGKDPYLCTPNRKEEQKNRNGGCRKDNRKRLKRIETQAGRTRPAGTETEDI